MAASSRVAVMVVLAGCSLVACGGRSQLRAGEGEPGDELERFCRGPARVEVAGEEVAVADPRLAVMLTSPQRLSLHFDAAGSTLVTFSVEAPAGAPLTSVALDLASPPAGWQSAIWAGHAAEAETIADIQSPRDPITGSAWVHAGPNGYALTACAWGEDPREGVEIWLYGDASL